MGSGYSAHGTPPWTRCSGRSLVVARAARGLDASRWGLLFARGAAGMNAFSQRLTEWINEAAQLCRMNYALALPQAYFTKGPAVWQETSQLLLPLYCGKNNTVLALTVLYQDPTGAVDGYYQAFTVLTLRMARQNARLITTPQVLWLADAQ